MISVRNLQKIDAANSAAETVQRPTGARESGLRCQVLRTLWEVTN